MAKDHKKSHFLTVAQIASLLQVHWLTVLRWIRKGELRAFKLGKGYRIEQADLDDFIRRHKTGGK